MGFKSHRFKPWLATDSDGMNCIETWHCHGPATVTAWLGFTGPVLARVDWVEFKLPATAAHSSLQVEAWASESWLDLREKRTRIRPVILGTQAARTSDSDSELEIREWLFKCHLSCTVAVSRSLTHCGYSQTGTVTRTIVVRVTENVRVTAPSPGPGGQRRFV